MYLCTKFQRSQIQIFSNMLFSSKKHRLFIAVLIAALPFFGFSNNQDSLVVKAATNPAAEVAEGRAQHAESENAAPLTEEQKTRKEISEHISHHVLDAHDF